jgi:hypothetical protein
MVNYKDELVGFASYLGFIGKQDLPISLAQISATGNWMSRRASVRRLFRARTRLYLSMHGKQSCPGYVVASDDRMISPELEGFLAG